MAEMQRWTGSTLTGDDIRRSPTAQRWAAGEAAKADLQAAQAAEQQAKHDAELAEAAREERLKDTIIDISTPELADEARKRGLV